MGPWIIVCSESHDWFLIPRNRRDDWENDMFEDDVNYAEYIGDPSDILIKEFEYDAS